MSKLTPYSPTDSAAEYVPTEEHAAAFAAWKHEGAAKWADVYPTDAGRAMLAAQKAHYEAEHARRYRRVLVTRTAEAGVTLNFGVFDRLNREIGARASCTHVTVVALADDDTNPAASHWLRTNRLGDFFTYMPHALRNGKGYGAWQGEVWFDTAAERDAGVDKYLNGARKRANKTAGVETLVP